MSLRARREHTASALTHACLRRYPRRQLVALGVAAAGMVAGCADSEWIVRRDIARFRLPGHVPIMVYETRHFAWLDRNGYAAAVKSALEAELEARGVVPEFMPLTGAPRLPRVELAFYGLEPGPSSSIDEDQSLLARPTSITVDCAFVSRNDRIAFIGRVYASGKGSDLTPGVEAVAHAVAEVLLDG